jgi:hypothetical protein
MAANNPQRNTKYPHLRASLQDKKFWRKGKNNKAKVLNTRDVSFK